MPPPQQKPTAPTLREPPSGEASQRIIAAPSATVCGHVERADHRARAASSSAGVPPAGLRKSGATAE